MVSASASASARVDDRVGVRLRSSWRGDGAHISVRLQRLESAPRLGTPQPVRLGVLPGVWAARKVNEEQVQPLAPQPCQAAACAAECGLVAHVVEPDLRADLHLARPDNTAGLERGERVADAALARVVRRRVHQPEACLNGARDLCTGGRRLFAAGSQPNERPRVGGGGGGRPVGQRGHAQAQQRGRNGLPSVERGQPHLTKRPAVERRTLAHHEQKCQHGALKLRLKPDGEV